MRACGANHAWGWECRSFCPERLRFSNSSGKITALFGTQSQLVEPKFGRFVFLLLLLLLCFHSNVWMSQRKEFKPNENRRKEHKTKLSLLGRGGRGEIYVEVSRGKKCAKGRRICRETELQEGGWERGDSSYLFCSDHGNHVHPLLPYHLPEVVACVWQGPLSCYVVPFCPTNHHLQTKEKSIGK